MDNGESVKKKPLFFIGEIRVFNVIFALLIATLIYLSGYRNGKIDTMTEVYYELTGGKNLADEVGGD
jgi:hypothetical protein